MPRPIAILLIALVASCAVPAQRRTDPRSEEHPPIAKSDAEKRILDTIEEAVKAGELYANVPAADGRMLRLLAASTNAKSVVEIGTSTGISGMWFAMALLRTAGRLTTFELDPVRAATARAHFKKAGVDGVVTIVEGDAHKNIARLKEPVDLVFIDAEKTGYIDYFNKLAPLVRPGGLILAHNVNMVRDYIAYIAAKPEFDTILYMQGEGLAISLKKR